MSELCVRKPKVLSEFWVENLMSNKLDFGLKTLNFFQKFISLIFKITEVDVKMLKFL